MGINDLPKPGVNFKATLGPGSFQRKLSGATAYGGLKNLRDNRKEIVEAVKNYQTAIKRGGLTRTQRLNAWQKIKQTSKARGVSLSYGDKIETKEILKHLARGQAGNVKKAVTAVSSSTVNNKSNLTEEQKQKNLARNQPDSFDIKKRMKEGIFQTTHFAAGDVQVIANKPIAETSSFGVFRSKEKMETTRGSMEDLGIKRVTGFAEKGGSKPLKTPPPVSPLGGIRPIGL